MTAVYLPMLDAPSSLGVHTHLLYMNKNNCLSITTGINAVRPDYADAISNGQNIS